MQIRHWGRLVLAAAVITGLGFVGTRSHAAEEDSTALREFPGHTAASEKRDQTFDVPGVVDKLLVKEGDTVKAGQLIAQQDIRADEARLKSLQLKATSELERKAEEAQLKKDTVDRDRKEELLKKNAIDPASVDEARLAVVVDTLKIERAAEDMTNAGYEVEEQKAKIEQKKLYAKIDGVVSQIATHEGELANSDTQHPTLTIVKNEPLYVEVDLPADVVKQLKIGQSLQVRYVDEKGSNNWRGANIRFISPEGDIKSNFVHVQLQMTNQDNRSSGLQVTVKLPDTVAVAAPNAVQVGADQ